LYIASAKTALNHIYPVAFAIMNANENEAGWEWFLQQLRSSLPMLIMDHPKPYVPYKYYTFISDRQKGLINALEKVFPGNHSCFCSIHIARNCERLVGSKVAKYVHSLSKTFSHREATELMRKVEQISKKVRNYLEKTTANQWRSTSWLDDPSLPPRYGIVTSNMSESMNNMFEKARSGSWLYSVDTILGIMLKHIDNQRMEVHGKEGVIERVKASLVERWENCIGYKVIEVQEGANKFAIQYDITSAGQSPTRYVVDVGRRSCDCGQWQEHGVPCIHAIAFFRLHQKKALAYILSEDVDGQYTYDSMRALLKDNIHPVCMDSLSPDLTTRPPIPSTKRSTGRPKKKRIRKRSRFAHSPEQSPIVCSRCKQKGHNVRTCIYRSEKKEGNPNTYDLDLE
jgi:hypothetical protein